MKERWTKLKKEQATDLHCQAVNRVGVADCPEPVEWEFLYHVRPFLQDDSDYVPIFYCAKCKEDRSAAPKWWSLRPRLPGTILRQRDYLAKALNTAQPKCLTCTSLSRMIVSELDNHLFTPAQQDQLALLQAEKLLRHERASH